MKVRHAILAACAPMLCAAASLAQTAKTDHLAPVAQLVGDLSLIHI